MKIIKEAVSKVSQPLIFSDGQERKTRAILAFILLFSNFYCTYHKLV